MLHLVVTTWFTWYTRPSMTLKHYFLVLLAGMLLAWGSLLLIVLGTDPETAPVAVFGLFYGSLFLGLTGFLSLIGIGVRTGILHKHDTPSRQVLIATRQASLLALLIVLASLLQARGALAWWTVLLLIGAITVLELLFISTRFSR